MFEKVNPCHPDKVADRIAGALVDLAYKKAENPRMLLKSSSVTAFATSLRKLPLRWTRRM